MCGICGTFGFTDRDMLRSMCACLVHRGPDGSGMHIGDGVGLAAVRLAMVDTQRNVQPAHNEDESVWVVFNGEMYNYRQWIPRLEGLGHRFYSEGDAETLVHLYEEYGPDFIRYVRGMFALGIWDSQRKRLTLIRDRLGVKPLYYARVGGGVVFASELTALAPYVPLDVDISLIPYYLQLRYFPSDRSPLRSVLKVPPGHVVTLDSSGIRTQRYWNVDDYHTIPGNGLDPAALQNLFLASIRLRLVSDVPLGVFLSGGLDSSAIVAGMTRLGVSEVRTFSIGFGEEYDETPQARMIAEHFGTRHSEIQLPGSDVVRWIPDIARFMDEPVADPACVPTYLLSAEAKKSVKGVLLGEGADEVFAGYEQYRALAATTSGFTAPAARWASRLPGPVFGTVLRAVSPFGSSVGQEFQTPIRRALTSNDSVELYLNLSQVFSEEELPAALQSYSGPRARARLVSYFTSGDPIRDAQRFDLENFLVHLLDRTDRMTMAQSIEGREPFLDHVLLEYAFSLPSRFHARTWGDKVALRRSLAGLLPSSILSRRKRRFFVPIDAWFAGELGSYFDNLMESPTLALLSREEMDRVRSRFRTSPFHTARQMWSLLCLELWFQNISSISRKD